MTTAPHFDKLQWSNLSDPEIWQAFQSGDWQAYEYVYTSNISDLFNYGMKVRTNRCLVEDAIQELFVELWQTRQKLAQVRTIKPYLYKSLRWKICHLYKRDTKLYSNQEVKNAVLHDHIVSPENDLIALQSQQQQSKDIQYCLSHLPDRQKEVLQLLFFDNLTHQEIAEIMEVKRRTVYVLCYRALSSLRNELVEKGLHLMTPWLALVMAIVMSYL